MQPAHGEGIVQTALPPAPPIEDRPPVRSGPLPGQGCVNVEIRPPCAFEYVIPSPRDSDASSAVFYDVVYRDSAGLELHPYILHARPDERAAVLAFFLSHARVECHGGWVSGPCNDTPHFEGFPVPSVGIATIRGR